MLRRRLENSNPNVEIEKVAYSISNMYYACSRAYTHATKPFPLMLSEDQWQLFFENARIVDKGEQEIFKKITKPFLLEDYCSKLR